MKILKQLTILFTICFFSEIIVSFFPFSFPASVFAIIVLFLLLLFKIIKQYSIDEVCNFLQNNMALFFIPPAISILEEFHIFKNKIIYIIIISFISFIITFIVTAFTINFVIFIQKKLIKKYNQ